MNRKPKSGQERDTSRCTKAARDTYKKMFNPRLKQSPRRQGKEREMHQQMRKNSKRDMYKEMYNPMLKQRTMLNLNPRLKLKPRLKVRTGKGSGDG